MTTAPTERRVALLGNPNSGKTSLFNELTGGRQRVGNYPGVTVEQKWGYAERDGLRIRVVDLPGSYSLSALSPEEEIACRAVLEDTPDAIVNVVDASNLRRNLYVSLQLIELGAPLILCLNMMDVIESEGTLIDTAGLAAALHVPVVGVSATKNLGIDQLWEQMSSTTTPWQSTAHLPQHLTAEIADFAKLHCVETNNTKALKSALRALDQDRTNRALMLQAGRLQGDIEGWIADFAERHKAQPKVLIATARYAYIRELVQQYVKKAHKPGTSWSQRIDAVLVHRFLGVPIFFALMWLTFQLTFVLGDYPAQLIEAGFAWLAVTAEAGLPDGFMRDALIQGVIGGVGGVLVFLPNIMILFLLISLLEDTGYMARTAVIMDRVMQRFGLQGKSFIPLLMGFGCTVPAIMATRTLENRRDRLLTMLLTPFMSCSAKLPVYTLLVGSFFSEHYAGTVFFALYLTGIAVGALTAKMASAFVLRGQASPFVMELPPYRLPVLKGLAIHMWQRAVMFIKKAGKLVLVLSLVMWVFSNYPKQDLPENTPNKHDQELAYSIAGRVGTLIEPIIEPIGLHWKLGLALIAGFAAKEVVVASLGTIYSIDSASEDSEGLRTALRNDPGISPLAACAFLMFILLYSPCISAVAVYRKEANSWGLTAMYIAYSTGIAWFAALIVYQGGKLLGLG